MNTRVTAAVFLVIAALWVHPVIAARVHLFGQISSSSFAVAVLTVAILLHEHFLWKTPVFRRFLSTPPNLGGEWLGEVIRRGPGGQDQPAQKVKAIVSQQASRIKFRLVGIDDNGKRVSDSVTITASLERLHGANGYSLAAVYRMVVGAPGSTLHDGAMVLYLQDGHDEPKTRTLAGQYWSQDGIRGRLEVHYVSRKIQWCGSKPDA